MREFTDGEPHEQQHQQLGDERGREHLDPDGLPQLVGVDQHLGENAQAGQGQDARDGQRAVEVEPQPEIVEQVQGDDQGGQQGDDDRDERGHEKPAADGRHEARHVDFVQTDEEEIEKYAEAQQDVNVVAEIDESQNGSEKNAGHRIGDDRVETKAPENAFGQLGDDDHHADGQ